MHKSTPSRTARRLCAITVALALALLTLVTGALPASAVPSAAVTSTTTATVRPGATTALAGVTVSNMEAAPLIQVIVSTDNGTLTMGTHANLTLDYGNEWSGDASISFKGTQADANLGLASLTMTTGPSSGVAQVSITALPSTSGFIYSPSNGHFYEYVEDSGTTWSAARASAQGREYLGQDGYLATMSTNVLNDLVANRIEGANNVWFGAQSIDTPGETVQRTWQWVDGPLSGDVITLCSNIAPACAQAAGSAYDSWAGGEPNNSGVDYDFDTGEAIPQSGEDVAVTNWGGSVGNWNDLPNVVGDEIDGYVVEYGNEDQGGDFELLATDTSTVNIVDVPNTPTAVTATRGDQKATITFTPGTANTSEVTGYRITRSPGDVVTSCEASPCVISGLTNGSEYTFTVVAVSEDGDSAASEASNVVIPATVPGPPSNVEATKGDTEATITFDPSTDNGGSTITSYLVTSSPGGVTKSCAGTPCLITGLTNGTSYSFTVHATNDVGDSVESAASGNVTPATTPGAPTNVSAVRGNGQATVSFTAPANDGGSPILGYGIASVPGGFTQPCPTGSPCTITGLTNGTAYRFHVAAANSVGIGTISALSDPVVPATVPGAPQDLEVTPDDGTAELVFEAPESNGGEAVTGYQYSIDDGDTWQTLTTSGTGPISATIDGLTNGTEYDVQVRAVNAVGSGAAANSEGPVTPAGVPAQVTGVTGARGDRLVTLTFPAPDDQGSPITKYIVTISPGGDEFECEASPCVVTDLDNGSPYTFKVRAVNDVGEGPDSAASDSITPAGRPSEPYWGTVTSAAGALLLTFEEGEVDGGSPVTGYQVSTDDGTSWSTLTVSGTSTLTGTVSGLVNGREYDVRVRAVNSVGAGADSETRKGTPATVPGRPRAVSVTGSGDRATVRWNAPAFNGGSAIVEYVVTAFPGGEVCSTTRTFCAFPDLSYGVRYTFSVVADNTATNKTGTGIGAAAESDPIRLTTQPGAPDRLKVTPGDRTLKVAFQPPLVDGSSRITGYEVSVNGGSWKRLPASARGLTIAPVLNGASYGVRVRAINANGRGPAAAVTVRTEAWFSDPVSEAAHRREIAIPSNPKAYRGPRRLTKATARSRYNTIAYPDKRLAGRQLQRGQAIDLAGASVFRFDSGKLTKQGEARVKSMVSSLRYVSKITCEGYADYAGSRSHEVSLSNARAKTVCDTIKKYAKQVTSRNVRAYGPNRPVVVGGKASDRAANRRVVVVVR